MKKYFINFEFDLKKLFKLIATVKDKENENIAHIQEQIEQKVNCIDEQEKVIQFLMSFSD